MKLRARLCIALGAAALIAAACFFANGILEDARAKAASRKLLFGLEDVMLEELGSSAERDAGPGEMPEATVDGLAVVGTLSVESIGIELPVAAQWSYDNLKKTVCRYAGTAEKGGLILLAHNYKTHFGNLKSLEKGEEVQLLDVNGRLYRYRVAVVETLHKTELDRLTNTEYPLTLFTCTYDAERRVTVRCERLINED